MEPPGMVFNIYQQAGESHQKGENFERPGLPEVLSFYAIMGRPKTGKAIGMNEQDYQKVFNHFTELSKNYGLGKIQHEQLYLGLKKHLGEVIELEVQASRRRQRAA